MRTSGAATAATISTQPELTVKLSDRIIMSPFAAKRLAQLLDNVVRQYEGRFGSLDTAQPIPTATASAATN